MDNYYPQAQSYGRKQNPSRYDLYFVKDWIEDEDAVTEKAAAYYTYVVEHN